MSDPTSWHWDRFASVARKIMQGRDIPEDLPVDLEALAHMCAANALQSDLDPETAFPPINSLEKS